MLGSLHAVWSLYWAAGGTWLLETVGQWAVEAAEDSPAAALAGLIAVSTAKLAAAWIPLLAESRRVPWRRLWRALGWIGGPFLILYGGADVVAGSAVLLGLLEVGDTDTTGLLGHALLWGPHFVLWGAALTVGLLLSGRRRRRPLGPQVSQ